MIRSEVGVTDFAPLAPDRLYVPEPERVVLTTGFEALLADRDACCFFVITRPFGISQMAIDTDHIKPTRHRPTSPPHRARGAGRAVHPGQLPLPRFFLPAVDAPRPTPGAPFRSGSHRRPRCRRSGGGSCVLPDARFRLAGLAEVSRSPWDLQPWSLGSISSLPDAATACRRSRARSPAHHHTPTSRDRRREARVRPAVPVLGDPSGEDKASGAALVEKAMARGLLLNAPAPDALRFVPALNVSDAEIGEMLDVRDGLLKDQ